MTPLGHRRLILTRHAKSSWDDPLMSDHDRPLNARGIAAARELGDFLASRGYDPEEVLCSTALRTRETWDGVARAALETRPELHYLTELYIALVDNCLPLLDAALWERCELALRTPSAEPLIALCAWGFDSMGEHDMAWHVLGEAYDRLEGVPLLRTMPPLWRWMERARPKALAASSSLDTGGARGRGHG